MNTNALTLYVRCHSISEGTILQCREIEFNRLLDKVLIDEKFVDPYYRSKRHDSVIISLACSEPLETCFCTSVGGSPHGDSGSDVLVCHGKDGSALRQGNTEKGGKLI